MMAITFNIRIFSLLGVLLSGAGCADQIGFAKVVVDPLQRYPIRHEDSVYEYYDGPTEITADLAVDDCSSIKTMCEIRFSDAELKGDTLHIEIFETNSVMDYHYRIKVFKGRFNISYWYQTTIDTAIREIQTVKQILVLDKGEYAKGDVINGHTEYKGECIKGCSNTDLEPIHIKGNFKARVK